MSFLRRALANWRKQRDVLAFASRFQAESRARIARLAETGSADLALRESASLMGIDMRRAERPRLVTLKGVRLR